MLFASHFFIAKSRYIDMQIDPIHQRTRDSPQIALDFRRTATAFTQRITQIAARTGIHRQHQHEPRRVGISGIHPGDSDLSILDRLPQYFEHLAGELGQLIQKQYAIVRQRHFTWPGNPAAASHCRRRDGVVRCTERALLDQPSHRAQQAGDAINLTDFQRLVLGHRWQNAGDAPGQHRLSRPGRACHQQVVTAGSCNLQSPFGGPLPLNIAKIIA